MKMSSFIKFLGSITVLMICIRPSYAGQLTTQDLLKLSIEELMEVKVVKEITQGRQQIDTSIKTPTFPPKQQDFNKVS